MPLKLNRKTDYALVAMCHLAKHARDEAEALSAREVADAYGMPRSLLMNLLKQLNRAGLAGSSRGVHGGYYLSRSAGAITVCDVIEAVEGPFQFALCCPEDEGHDGEEAGGEAECRPCAMMKRCPIGPSIRRLSERVEALLQSVTLQDMIDGRVESAAGTNGGSGPRYELAIMGSRGRPNGIKKP